MTAAFEQGQLARPAASFNDTELDVFMKLEVNHGTRWFDAGGEMALTHVPLHFHSNLPESDVVQETNVSGLLTAGYSPLHIPGPESTSYLSGYSVSP